jgi:two-component system chemotaxis response regulator CheB
MRKDIVVIGASSGGIQAVSSVLQELPGDFPAYVFVVVHLFAGETSTLPRIFSQAGELPALNPRDNEAMKRGLVYVAPPDKHMILEKDRIRLFHSPKENLHRPAIDPLFRSVAFYYRSRVIGVLLTGADSDGTSGLFSVKMKGGLAIVQDPKEAQAPVMPFSALTNLKLDYVRPVAEIGPLLLRLIFEEKNSARG